MSPSSNPTDRDPLRTALGLAVFVLLALAMGARTAAADLDPRRDRDFHDLARADHLLRAGDYDAQLAVGDSVLARGAERGDEIVVTRARLARAGALAQMGRLDEARAESETARSEARAIGDAGLERVALRWSAVVALRQGRQARAESLYAELDSTARSSGDELHAAYADFGRAYLALLAEEFSIAIERYDRAIEGFARTGESGLELDARIGRARALNGMGRIDEMRAEYALVISRSEDTDNPRALGMALNNLGAHEYETGDPARAVTWWERAAGLASGRDLRNRLTPATNLLLAHMELGDFGTARERAEVLLEECAREGLVEAAATLRLRLAGIEAALGDLERARALARGVFDEISLPVPVRAEALRELGGVEGRRRGPAAQARTISEGLLALGPSVPPGWRTRLRLVEFEALVDAGDVSTASSREENVRALALGSRSDDLIARFDVAYARSLLVQERPDSALAALERARARWETRRSLPRDPQWRERRGALGQSLHLELARLLLSHPPQDPVATRAQRAFELLSGYKARTLAERMSGPAHPEPAPAPRLDLRSLQREHLLPGDVVLDFHLDDRGSLLFVVTVDTCAAFELPPRGALFSRAALLYDLVREDLGSVEKSDIHDAVFRVAEELLGPARAHVADARRIVFVPDAFTHLLPLEFLARTSIGEPSRGIPMVRAPSVWSWHTIRSRAPVSSAGILTVAGVRDRLLPGAEREIELLQRRFARTTTARLVPGTPFADQLFAQADGFAVLHVAAHGEAVDQRPWSSHLSVLVGGTAVGIEASEIASHSPAPPLTVLSSCESAGGRILRGEGVLGFSSAFLVAGSRAVVATLWPVDDAVTARLMDIFYRELAHGADVSTALDRAKDAIRAHAATEHPMHWAGFVVVGDGSLRVEGLTERRGLARAALPIMAAAIGLGLLALSTAHGRRISSRFVTAERKRTL